MKRLFGILLLLVMFNAYSNTMEAPEYEKNFIKTVESHYEKYNNSDNELKKSAVRTERKKELAALVKRNPKDWIGTIKDMGTTGKGNAYVSIKLPDSNIILTTEETELGQSLSSAKTLITHGEKVYNDLAELSKGDKVRFTGFFVKSERDHIYENSLTEEGSMMEPEFLFKFSSISSS